MSNYDTSPHGIEWQKVFGGSGDLLGHFGEGISFPIYFACTIWKDYNSCTELQTCEPN